MTWKKVKLGEVITHRKGFITISDNENYKLCRVQLHRRGVVLRQVVSGATIRTKKQQICKANDFIVAEMDAKVGGYGFIPENLDESVVSSHYYLFEVNEKLLKRKFLDVLINKEILQNQIKATGSTNYASVRPSDVLSWIIPLPSISEQEEIIEKYFAVEKHSNQINTELSHQLNLVKKLRQQILQDAVQGKLVNQNPDDESASILLKKIKAEKEQLIKEKKVKKDKYLSPIKAEEIPFDIPDSWVWCKLGELCSKIGSGSTPKGSNYSNNGIPFFRSQNIHNEGLVYDDIKFISNEVHKQMNGTVVYANDILLNITGGSLGRAALVPNNFEEGNVSQHVCIIRGILIDNFFLHKVILSPYFQRMIFDSTTGAGREGLPKYNLEQFQTPLPPLPEQHRIVAKVESLMRLCDELEANIQQNQKYTQQLLQAALRDALQEGNQA